METTPISDPLPWYIHPSAISLTSHFFFSGWRNYLTLLNSFKNSANAHSESVLPGETNLTLMRNTIHFLSEISKKRGGGSTDLGESGKIHPTRDPEALA
jgi:hypothetical protein